MSALNGAMPFLVGSARSRFVSGCSALEVEDADAIGELCPRVRHGRRIDH
jgi:hypothetical protein